MATMPPSLTDRADQFARHAVVLLGFSIPLSVALDNILLVLVAMLWLASGAIREKIAAVAANPVAVAALLLFGMLAAGLLYGVRLPGDGPAYLGKYVDLLFVPIFITLFREARARELALRWFCAAMVLTFVVAELTISGALETNPWLPRGPGFPGAFKNSVTHGVLAAFAAFVFALLAQREARWPQRLLYAVLAFVAVKNVMLIAISRTAYLVLALLTLYFFYIQFGKRGLAIACLVLAVLFAAAYGGAQTFRARIDTVAVEILRWRPDRASHDSVDLRLEWYRRSVNLVREHPLLGSGTGSFPRVYADAVESTAMVRTTNPHNEYLLIAVQTGLVGLALLLHLFWRQLALASRLASPLETHLARGLVITVAAGCLFNSFLLDHSEGLFYAWFTGLLYAGLQSKRDG
jgi:O-antigen ligase